MCRHNAYYIIKIKKIAVSGFGLQAQEVIWGLCLSMPIFVYRVVVCCISFPFACLMTLFVFFVLCMPFSSAFNIYFLSLYIK